MTLKRSPARWLLVCALFVVTLARGAVAQGQDAWTPFEDVPLSFRVITPWPAEATDGFIPIFVELKSSSDVPMRVSIRGTAQHWRAAEHRVEAWVDLGPNATTRVELFCAAFDVNGASYRFRLKVGRQTEEVSTRGSYSYLTPNISPVVVLSAEDPSDAELEAWTIALGNEVTEGSEVSYDVDVVAVLPEYAPLRFEPYTSLDAVIIDTRNRLAPSVLGPVLTYARLGGTIAFFGPDAERVARETAGVNEWMDARFAVSLPLAADAEDDGDVDAVIEPAMDEHDIYAIGHGRLLIGSESTFPADVDMKTLRAVFASHESFTPTEFGLRPFHRDLAIPNLRELPYRVFMVALILFALAVGPLNFWIIKRAGRPAWLLITIPVFAVLGTVGILAYGIFYQGVELKFASETFTVLDQRVHRADSVALRSYFAGLAPTDGLRPSASTACFPTPGLAGRDELYTIEMDPSPVLSGQYLPVRRAETQIVISERAARGRLELRPDGDGLVAVNALGASVRGLCVRAEDGLYYAWNLRADAAQDQAVVNGDTIRLERLDDRPDLASVMPQPIDGRDLGWSLGMPRSTYIASLDENPFVDSMGLEPDGAAGRHIVLGILASGDSSGEER